MATEVVELINCLHFSTNRNFHVSGKYFAPVVISRPQQTSGCPVKTTTDGKCDTAAIGVLDPAADEGGTIHMTPCCRWGHHPPPLHPPSNFPWRPINPLYGHRSSGHVTSSRLLQVRRRRGADILCGVELSGLVPLLSSGIMLIFVF